MERDGALIVDDPSNNSETNGTCFPQSNTTKEQPPLPASTESKTPAGLLQKMTLAEDKSTSSQNTRQAYPALKLSGNIISATICLPYNFEYGPSGWVCDACMDSHIR